MATMGTTTVPNMQVSCGLSHTVVCTDDGKVWTFGAGRQGQLGTHELHDNQDVPVLVSDAKNNTQEDDEDQIGSKPVIDVAAGSYHTVALRKHGSVYSWGSNANGRLGHGTSAEEMNNRSKCAAYILSSCRTRRTGRPTITLADINLRLLLNPPLAAP